MSLTDAMMGTIAWSFPRVSGDEPAKSALGNLGNTFSPRERG